MVIVKVHVVISFAQSKWLEKYICFNTQKRNEAKNEFKKNSTNRLTTELSENF